MMKNNKRYLVMGIVILVVGAAAFVSGRMFNAKIAPLGLLGGSQSRQVQVIPAEELPDVRPDVTGLLLERKDNSITVEPKGTKISGGPSLEVVITNKTIIYQETTELSGPPPSGGDLILQQTVGEGTLDDINPHALVSVWGRKSGDRVIADVLFYSNIMVIQEP